MIFFAFLKVLPHHHPIIIIIIIIFDTLSMVKRIEKISNFVSYLNVCDIRPQIC